MRIIIVYLVSLQLLFISNSANAQNLVMVADHTKTFEGHSSEVERKKTFEFYAFSDKESLKNFNAQVIDEHFLGDSIARKMYLFIATYTVKTPISPGSPTMKTSIRKPVIYASVRKIERQLKKDIKNNVIKKEAATISYSKVLDIAINIINDVTEEFEKEIENLNSPDLLLQLYTQRVTLRYL
jgi:hypothetical protein